MNIEIVETTDIIIYPNPSKNILVLECTENHKSSGTIYIYNGDSISGKFTHLTPRNDYYTTHIIFKTSSGQNKMVNRY